MLILHRFYKHFCLTPICLFALVLALKSVFAAQAPCGSDFCISRRYVILIFGEQCHFKIIENHWLYKQNRQTHAPAMLSKRYVLSMLDDPAPRFTQVAPKTSQSGPNIAPTWPKIGSNGNKVPPRYCQDGINLA